MANEIAIIRVFTFLLLSTTKKDYIQRYIVSKYIQVALLTNYNVGKSKNHLFQD